MSRDAFPNLDTPFVQADEKKPEAARMIAIPWYRLLIAFWNRTGGATGYVAGQNQPGMMSGFGGAAASVPDGYLLCDGATYLIADYPDLFAAIGYTWGGAGASFAVPDGTGRALIGSSGGFALGTTGGASSHAITQAELPNVVLPVTDPGHLHFTVFNEVIVGGAIVDATHAVARAVNDGVALDYALRGASSALSIPARGPSSPQTTGITVASGGSGDPIPTLPPYFVGNWIIKT